MEDMKDIEKAVNKVTAKVAALKTSAQETEARLTKKKADLEACMADVHTSNAQRIAIQTVLQDLTTRIASKHDRPSLAEIEEAMDQVYGDQSLNETYYFSRRGIKASIQERFDRAVKKADAMGWHSMSLEDVETFVDDIYGDQSLNETYYPSREACGEEECEACEEKRDADLLDNHRIYDDVDTYGYWADEVDEMPETVQHVTASVRGLNPEGNIILEQMGGSRRLSMFLGVTGFYDVKHGVGIKWPNKTRSLGNYVEIVLNASDLYDMKFYNKSKRGSKLVKTYSGLYADMLVETFENHTGWYLR